MKEKTVKKKPNRPPAEKRQPLGQYLKEQLKSRPVVTAIMALYFGFCLASVVYFMVVGRWRDIGFALLYAAAVPLFYGAEYLLRQKCPVLFVVFVMFWLLGSFIGPCYNVYAVPHWDDVMHFCWGIVFAGAGFSVIKVLMGEPDDIKKFFGCIIFAFAFCLMIAVFWEIFEFVVDRISPDYDMQADTYIFDINSFLLYPAYDHVHTEQINGIIKTVIYLSDGSTYTLEGGYLDVGLFDTMWDLIWCTLSVTVLSIALIIDRFCGKHFYKLMIPATTKKAVETVESIPADGAPVEAEETVEVRETSTADKTE